MTLIHYREYNSYKGLITKLGNPSPSIEFYFYKKSLLTSYVRSYEHDNWKWHLEHVKEIAEKNNDLIDTLTSEAVDYWKQLKNSLSERRRMRYVDENLEKIK